MKATLAERDISILIPAAGLGSRLGLGPKALVELNGKPLLFWLTQKVKLLATEIIIAAPSTHIDAIKDLRLGVTIIAGGATREDSIRQLVAQSTRNYVAIIPVAFPFASVKLISQVIEKGIETGAAAAYLQPNTPISLIEAEHAQQEFWHDTIGIFQAPQCYCKTILSAALSQDASSKQSTVGKVIAQGKNVAVVDGEKTNIKITDSVDWLFAQSLTEYLT